ncbi:MAG: CHASE2 domain-containing protein, partial [Pseudomonadales bacterium]
MGNDKRRYDAIAIVVLFLMAVFLEYKEAFSLIEDETLSYRQILRTHYADPSHTSPSEDVVIIYTDEAFYAEYGVYPLRRVDLATIIVRLAELDASVIGVDMLLDFASAYGEDPTLQSALQEAGNVLLVSQAELEDGTYRGVNRAIPRFDRYADSGYSNISPNSAISESIVRLRVYPEVAADGEWPFAIQAVANHLAAEAELDGRILKIGEQINIPLDQFGDIYIDYPLLPLSAEGGTLRLHDVIGLSAADVLFIQDKAELAELAYFIKDKIVLVG